MRRIECAGSSRTTTIGRCRSRSRRGGERDERADVGGRHIIIRETHARAHARTSSPRFRFSEPVDSRHPSTVCIHRAYRAPRPLEYVFRVYTV